MDGLLLIDKPRGWTSFDVVNYVRKVIAQAAHKKPKQVKVGHTGTLDPLATGLLVLVIGSYTKRAPDLTKLDKTYEVTMKLGETSTTGDEEGDKVAISSKRPTKQAIEQVLQQCSGKLMQTPPRYSALKVNGQRAYKLARQGKAVTLEPRPVEVYQNSLISYDYPLVWFASEVSSGTFVRSLVEDLGAALTSGAYLAELRRTTVGDFKIEDALSIENLSSEKIYQNLQQLT
jgi:tRNA pseudouridine55 synthase